VNISHPQVKKKKCNLDNLVIRHRQMAMLLWLVNKESKHGYALMKDMEGMGFGSFKASRAYPMLSKMCRHGLLEKRKRGRKIYYSITERGKGMLEYFKKWIRHGKTGDCFREMVG